MVAVRGVVCMWLPAGWATPHMQGLQGPFHQLKHQVYGNPQPSCYLLADHSCQCTQVVVSTHGRTKGHVAFLGTFHRCLQSAMGCLSRSPTNALYVICCTRCTGVAALVSFGAHRKEKQHKHTLCKRPENVAKSLPLGKRRKAAYVR
jgi:hypothetical protein